MDMQILILIISAFLTVFLLGTILFGEGKTKQTRKKRLHNLANIRMNNSGQTISSAYIRKEQQDKNRLLNLLQQYAPKKHIIEQKIAQTGKKISVGQFVFIMLLVSISLTGLFLILQNFGWFLSVFLGGGLGIILPLFWVKFISNKRQSLFLRDFPDAIDLMVRGLRSGLPVSEGINSVAREFSGPIQEEFQKVVEEVRFGTDLETALWSMAKRVPVADVKFFVITLSIQKDTGGNLAETLMNLSTILRSRKQMVLKVKALSSEAKASAMILGSLPFVLFAILSLLSPDYIFMLFEDPRGQKMTAIGGGLIVIGILVMRKMVKFRI